MALFGSSVKQSGAQATGAASGGFGAFNPDNNISLGSKFIDFTDSSSIGALALVLVAGVLAWKRF